MKEAVCVARRCSEGERTMAWGRTWLVVVGAMGAVGDVERGGDGNEKDPRPLGE